MAPSSGVKKKFEPPLDARKTQRKKPKRRDKSDLGPDFVAPDGGWGWVVCIASGLIVVFMLAGVQQYGLIYRERMNTLGFTAQQVTTIISGALAVKSLIGIINGPMFRRFTFRQVGMLGSLFGCLGIFATAFCTTFEEYILAYSIIYGFGLGFCGAATTLALNTYFKEKRRKAAGFACTISGFAPIILPHVTTYLLGVFGAQGTMILYSGFALNAVVCAMTLQPVLWHTKNSHQGSSEELKDLTESERKEDVKTSSGANYQCQFCQEQRAEARGIYYSQLSFIDEEPNYLSFEGYRRQSSNVYSSSNVFRTLRHHSVQEEVPKHPKFQRSFSLNRKREDPSTASASFVGCTCALDKAFHQTEKDSNSNIPDQDPKGQEVPLESEKVSSSFWSKVVKFFDLDLLKDLTFLNLVFGMTVMMFCEVNFSVMTPFILSEHNFNNSQISMAMSILGGMDICVRFIAPFILDKVKLGNQFLFGFGILITTCGRFIISLTSNRHVILGTFVIIGFGRGFRAIFNPLIISSYVPLKRLPAASGLHLMFSGLFTLAFGPVLGTIIDATSYNFLNHLFNILIVFALMLWSIEGLLQRSRRKKAEALELS